MAVGIIGGNRTGAGSIEEPREQRKYKVTSRSNSCRGRKKTLGETAAMSRRRRGRGMEDEGRKRTNGTFSRGEDEVEKRKEAVVKLEVFE